MVTRQETAEEAASAPWRSRLCKDEDSQTHLGHGAIMPHCESVLGATAPHCLTRRPATAWIWSTFSSHGSGGG
jgi:hypothetical protein